MSHVCTGAASAQWLFHSMRLLPSATPPHRQSTMCHLTVLPRDPYLRVCVTRFCLRCPRKRIIATLYQRLHLRSYLRCLDIMRIKAKHTRAPQQRRGHDAAANPVPVHPALFEVARMRPRKAPGTCVSQKRRPLNAPWSGKIVHRCRPIPPNHNSLSLKTLLARDQLRCHARLARHTLHSQSSVP